MTNEPDELSRVCDLGSVSCDVDVPAPPEAPPSCLVPAGFQGGSFKVPQGFYQGSFRVATGLLQGSRGSISRFLKGSIRVPLGFVQGSFKVLAGLLQVFSRSSPGLLQASRRPDGSGSTRGTSVSDQCWTLH